MSPVILLGLVVMWAVVLIPMWLKRHDEAEETRSVDRFTTAMHTLSRRDAPADKRRYVVMPHRSSSHEVHVSGASASGRPTSSRRPARPARATATAAARRRRTLIGLLVVTTLTFVAAFVVGGLGLWALQAIGDLTLVAFVMHLRNRARRAVLVRPARRRPAAPVRSTPRYEPVYDDRAIADSGYDEYDEYLEDEPYERFAPVPVRSAAPAAKAIFDQTALHDDVAFEDVAVGDSGPAYRFDDPSYQAAAAEAVFDQTEVIAPTAPARVAAYDSDGRDLEVDVALTDPASQPEIDVASEIGARPWEPVPVPRPSYASKPAAPRRTRQIPEFEPLLPPVETPHELDPVDDLEEILDRRWAVND